MPEILIENDAQEYIKTVSFDTDIYVDYLRNHRKMTDADIDNISIIFTNEGVSTSAIANTEPGFMNDGHHIIRISPTRLPLDRHKQGRVLRHETEHIIQGCSWQYKAWVLGQLSTVGVSTIGAGTLFTQQIYEVSESLSEPARITLSTIGALGGAAMGMFVGTRIGKQLNPLEVGAMVAERRYAAQLPDGVLVVTG